MSEKMLELFSGSAIMSKTFKEHGWDTCSIDIEAEYHPDWNGNIGMISKDMVLERFGHPDVIWSSPPCECFSVASIGHHWNIDKTPKTVQAKYAMVLHTVAFKLIESLAPRYWFIENPRAMLRRMPWMQGSDRYTITFCQYGERRMKPTDIWTNHPDPKFKPACGPCDPCHASAPRGSRTGTQGIKGAYARGILPKALCEHVVEICEVLKG
jgi:site-specific DNA-cytosine methylase